MTGLLTRLHGNPWAILATVSLGFFMPLLDVTIVDIAIPSMLDDLHAGLDEVLWVGGAYTLTLAALMITSGRLADAYGARTMFVLGVPVFTLASVLCGLAQNAGELIGARAVQGLGAALLIPQTMTIIAVTFPADRRGTALGIWGSIAGLATISGPTVGGFLVTTVGWRWVFFVNLPVGLLVLGMALAIIPAAHPGGGPQRTGVRRMSRRQLDTTGILIATAALFCLVFSLTEGQRYGWGAIWSFVSIPLLLAVAVVLFAVFLVHQRARQGGEPRPRGSGRHAHPGPRHRRERQAGELLLPFALFRDRNYSVMTFVSATVLIGLTGVSLPITIYLQSVLGMSALQAGLTMAPTSVVAMCLTPFAGTLSDRIGGKYVLLAGLSLYVAGMTWFMAIAGVDSRSHDFLPALIIAGLGQSGMNAPLLAEAMRDVQPALAGAASGVLSTTRQVASVVGTATVGALLQNRLATALTTEAAHRAESVPPEYRGYFLASFSKTAESGLELGVTQAGVPLQLPADVPAAIALHLHGTAESAFDQAFVDALRPALSLPILIALVGAITCLATVTSSRRRTPSPAKPVDEPLTVSERARLRELERENRELRLETEFLAHAAAIFAGERWWRPGAGSGSPRGDRAGPVAPGAARIQPPGHDPARADADELRAEPR